LLALSDGRLGTPAVSILQKIGEVVNSNLHNRQWYALQIRPRFEKLAARHLNGKGYEGYLPVYTARRRWSDRMKSVEVPLFPGYTFCRFDIQERLHILVSPGVLSIVGIGKTPTAVSDREIFSIQQLIASGLPCGPWPFVQVGQNVYVERGPLAGLEGIVIEVKSSLRLILSLPLLQRSVAVEIDRDCVGKTSDKSRSAGTTLVNNPMRARG
jgi:transcription antitermination factor NusG